MSPAAGNFCPASLHLLAPIRRLALPGAVAIIPPMQKRDTFDVMNSVVAVVADALAIFAGFKTAIWLRFNSDWFRGMDWSPMPPNGQILYTVGAAAGTLVCLVVFKVLDLYVRPQTGSFPSRIPRLVRAVALGLLYSMILAFLARTEPPFSRLVIGLAGGTVTFLVLLERYILFRIEWNLARHSHQRNHVLIVGVDEVASHIRRTLQHEPMLRSEVAGFIHIPGDTRCEDIHDPEILGDFSKISDLLAHRPVDQIILASNRLSHEDTVNLIFACEKSLITFNMVPDLFRIMTSSMDVQSLDDIPLLGISRWPLDIFWNRALKRIEDIVGSIIGLFVTSPVMLLCAIAVRLSSTGPVFFKQVRCGENGHSFTIFKFRTMGVGAESTTGPVFASPNDPRTTRIGAMMRRWNFDELPQLWNVLRGDMTLVGPRPERPHFVEQFKEGINRYMWRHICRPGMTGWAQVNGLRGNTSIDQRVKYDLYYLENWSLAFDFKILIRTLFTHKNAY